VAAKRMAEVGIAIELRLPRQGPLVLGQPDRFEQVLVKLLTNAVEALEGRADGRVVVAFDGGVLSLSDNGPGIADAEKSRVTERFYRGDANRDAAGAGLGLSLVAAVGRLHGGNLTLADACPGLIAKITLPSCSASTMGC